MADINQAVALHNGGNFQDAEKMYLEILNNEPDNAYVNNLLGLLCSQTTQFEKAEFFLKKAVELEDNENYLENLGVCYYLQDKYSQAMPYFERAIEKVPKDLQRIRDYAKLAKDAKQWEYAIKFYSKSVEIDKRDYVGLNNIGLGLEALEKFEQAKPYYERSLKIKPNYSAYHNLGVWFRRARDFEQSIRYLKRALQFQPKSKDTFISLGMSYLSMKDFENGYKYYKLRCPEIKARYINEWHGEEHKDSNLVVFYDGGRGDQLMFCRYLPFVQEKFKNVTLLAYPELKSLFKQNYPDINVCEVNDKYNYQYSVNFMEMHHALLMDFDNIPYSEGYLKADANKVQEYKEKYFQTDKKKIGLFWQGNLKVFPYRSMKFEQMKPLLQAQNCQFYSCQKGDGIEQLDNRDVINLGETFKDYSDTAAALKNLDVLVTIDSSIAHLAGALGVKTFLLLPQASEWRWFSETKKTDWYKSVEIFKQEKLYDWQKVIADVLEKLNNL